MLRRTRLLGILLFLAVLFPLWISHSWAQDSRCERCVALVMGIGAYEHQTHLRNPPRDAQAVGKVLSGMGFETEVKTDLDLAGLNRALQQFKDKAVTADTAILFFSGHGIEISGNNYMLPKDVVLAKDTDAPFETVPLDLARSSVAGSFA